MRVGIYARVSTRDQSCDLQLRDLRAYCAARQLTVAREYVDAGVSGTKDSRPQLNELMADARKRKLDAILVWRFDRFARSTRHLLLALEEFRGIGLQFISYQENIDTGTPLGQALFVIIAAIAELERGLICERVSAGIRNARAKGKRLGRPASTLTLAALQSCRLQERASDKLQPSSTSAMEQFATGCKLVNGNPYRRTAA
jgi:DNA invertase Pin-like site-specific DNA recombinase